VQPSLIPGEGRASKSSTNPPIAAALARESGIDDHRPVPQKSGLGKHRTGGHYERFPDPENHRILLADSLRISVCCHCCGQSHGRSFLEFRNGVVMP
jgi:hypothetical protein